MYLLVFFSIKNNQVAFVSLEANKLESDLKLIYDKLSQDHSFVLKTVLINYNKKNLINNFLYLLNCIKQIYVINTSKVVLITDNNYVISNFKREGVKSNSNLACNRCNQKIWKCN